MVLEHFCCNLCKRGKRDETCLTLGITIKNGLDFSVGTEISRIVNRMYVIRISFIFLYDISGISRDQKLQTLILSGKKVLPHRPHGISC